MKKETLLRFLWLNLGVAASYWVVSWLNWLLFKNGGVLPMPLWPAAGLAVAAAFRFGWKVTPGLFFGAALANIFPLGADWKLAVLIGLMNAFSPAAAVTILRSLTKKRKPFQSLHDLVAFVCLAVILHPALTATGGIGGRWLLGQIEAHAFWSAWQGWWLAHAVGTILFAPIFMVWLFPEISRPSNEKGKYLFVSGATLLFALLIFFFVDAYSLGLPYLLIIPMAWAAARSSMVQTMGLFTLVILIGLAGIVMNPLQHTVDMTVINLFRVMAVAYSMVLLVLCIMRNTQKEIEGILQAKTIELERYFDSSLDLLCIANIQGNFIRVNREWERVLGYRIEELEGKSFLSFVHPDDLPATLEAVSILAQQKEILNFTNRYRCKDGSYRFIEWRSSPRGEAIYAIARDITERKLMEDALQQSEARFRSLSESAPVGIAISDSQQKNLYVNKKFTELTGYTLEDIPTLAEWMQLAYPEEGYRISLEKIWAEAVAESIRTRTEITPIECRIRRKDGAFCYLEIGAVGTDQLTFVTFVDVTRRRMDEEVIRESEAKYRQITENMTDVIWTADLDFNFTYVSPSVFRVFGLSPEAFITQPVAERYTSESLNQIQAIQSEQRKKLASGSVEKQERWIAEMEAIRKDGQHFWVQNIVTFVFDDSGKPAGILGTISDITDRWAVQERLKRSEERMRFALETSQLGAWDLDLVDHTAFRSLQHDQIFGYQELLPEWTYEMFMQHVHPEDRAEVHAKFQEAIEKKTNWNFECRIIRADGEERWIWAAGTHIADSRGTNRRMAGIVQDITERKRGEQALKENEIRYRAFFEQSPDGVVILDPSNGNFMDFNDQTCKQLGYTREELSHMNVADIEVLETSAEVRAHIQSILAAGQGEFETQHRTKQGEVRDIHVIARVINTGQQEIYHCIWRDITERKRAEEALRQEKVFTDAIFTSVPGLLYLYSEDGYLLRWNKRHEELTGYSSEELDHFYLLDWYRDEPEDIERITRGVQRALTEGFATEEGHLVTKDGSVLLFDFTAARLELGGKIYFAGIGIDISERRKAEEAIQAAQAKLEQLLEEAEVSRRTLLSLVEDQKAAEEQIRKLNQELERRVKERTAQLEMANQELESFSYSVSHDLRAPLRALDGFSSALLEDYAGKLDDQGQHYLERIQEASRRMGQLINDLLNLSRVTRSDFVRRRVNLTGLARQIVEDLRAQAPERQVDFDIAADMVIDGDANLIRIAMENLLHNAFKFTSRCDRAFIQVGMTEQNGEKVYFVRDNGAGFNMDHASKLFTPFQRLHRAQEFPGTGIGLSIVQRIIARHGGRIWPESEIGRGTTFNFTLGGQS
ncbi:MAG TPA: PAS domain S-box protein [Anaerolineaceae bacterium]|nr:PAS domain S-box protein [Anaerolineaceae bacterium]HPN53240.1 PAS domain S-box protein [Anaerolineaceae bacterium]